MLTHDTGDIHTGKQQATLLFKQRMHKIVCTSSQNSSATSLFTSSSTPSPTSPYTKSWFFADFTDGTLLTNVEDLDEAIEEVVAAAAAASFAATLVAGIAAKTATETAAETATGAATETATGAATGAATETSSPATALVSPYAASYTKSYLEASAPASAPAPTLAGDVPRVYTVFYNRETKAPVQAITSTNSANPALCKDSSAPTLPQVAILPPQHVWVAIQRISAAFDLAETDVKNGTDYGTYAYLNQQTMAARKAISGDRAPRERAPIWVEPCLDDDFIQVGAKRAFANAIAVA